MKVESKAKRVTIYVNSTDQWHGRPLYGAIVQRCQDKGLAGATVFRCVEGFGAGHEMHTSRFLFLSDNMPVCIEIIDTAERIEPFLAGLDDLIGSGLVVIADVHTIHYRPG